MFSIVVSCILIDCFFYVIFFLKFNFWIDLLVLVIEFGSLKFIKGRIGFNVKVILRVVGKVIYLIDLRFFRFLFYLKKIVIIFYLVWGSCRLVDVY